MSRTLRIVALGFLTGLGLAACGTSSPGTSLAQPCNNGVCAAGFVCMDGFCVPLEDGTGDTINDDTFGTSASTSAGTFTTTGDGDGDPDDTTDTDTGPGDGDGDPDTGPGDGDGDPDTGPGDGDGDGDGDGLPNGSTCTADFECASANCYVVPFLGGQCGECNEDLDCVGGGCTPPNPFANNGSVCNMGELGGGCESNNVCQPGLSCGTVLDLLGLIQISTCGECTSNIDCGNQICAPIVDVASFSGANTCINPGSLPQDAFCDLNGGGDQACASGICSTVDIMGLSEVGACGQCNSDFDCNGNCMAGDFDLGQGILTGSTCN